MGRQALLFRTYRGSVEPRLSFLVRKTSRSSHFDRNISSSSIIEASKLELIPILSSLFAISLIYFVAKLYIARALIWERKKRGLVSFLPPNSKTFGLLLAHPLQAPGHSFFVGHLLYFKSALDKLPPNAHYQNALGDVAREHFQKEGCYYIDMWPVSGLLFIIVSPHIANQIHANPNMSMQRPPLLPRFFKPIAGGPNMFDMRETDWKPWRAVFSRAFSTEHVLSLVPDMVEETTVYCETLRKLAEQKEMFQLDLVTLCFTIDVIGKTIL